MVSHSGFLRFGVSHSHYANADYRIFGFAEGGGEELVEWKLTKERGGGLAQSYKGKASILSSDNPHGRKEDCEWKEVQAPKEIVQEVPG